MFLGRTGLGKTHLSLSIANVAIDKGFGVIYGSSQNFFNQIQDEAFGRKQGDTLNALLDCDLLILDDFGTEFMSTYISSAIYNIINSRILRSLPTIISTNLSLSEINSQYGERIMSRILGNYVIKQFTGKDIRQIQMLKNNT
ncbi:MAG: ATP-binding protein [Clostridia bacterium]|nr:ATP-binding protein [Clostridia bacterium]